MIAGYAFSNLTIVSLVTVKLSYFAEEEMDIFIRSTPGLSENLLEGLAESSIFRNTYFIEPPLVQFKRRGKYRSLLSAPRKAMSFYKHYKKEYEIKLEGLAKSSQYDIFLCPYFTNDSIFYIDYFSSFNPNMEVSFCDEGGLSLLYTIRELCHVNFGTNILNERIKRKFTMKKLCRKHKRRMNNTQYIYGGQKLVKDSSANILPLLSVTSNPANIEYYDKLFICQESTLMYYAKRQVYFFVAYPTEQEPDYESKLVHNLNTLFEIVSPNRSVIRLHPNNTSFKKKVKETISKTESLKGAYVDDGVLASESVFYNVELDNKIIIVDSSSTASIQPKLLFDKEAIIISISKLSRRYYTDTLYREHTDSYFDYLREIYSDKTRIYQPSSVREFKKNAAEAYLRVQNYSLVCL